MSEPYYDPMERDDVEMTKEDFDAMNAANDSCPTPCSRCADHHKLLRIFSEIDRIIVDMCPSYHAHPTMDGKYPAWHVWLPSEGRTMRKTLQDALIDYVDQAAEIHAAIYPA